jgi:hypothetical protein
MNSTMKSNKFTATLRMIEFFGDEVSEDDFTLYGVVRKKKNGTFTFTHKCEYTDTKTVYKFEYFDKKKMIFMRHKGSEHGAKIESI